MKDEQLVRYIGEEDALKWMKENIDFSLSLGEIMKLTLKHFRGHMNPQTVADIVEMEKKNDI